MTTKSIITIVSMGLLTAVILPGSIFVIFFFLLDVVSVPTLHVPVPFLVGLALLLAFAVPAVGGVFWGWGIASLMRAPTKELARTGAFSWSISVLIAGIVLYFSQIPLAGLDRSVDLFRYSRYSTHYGFTFVFTLAVGIVTTFNTRNMAAKLGIGELARLVGRNSGLVAAIVFTIVSLILLFVFGWQVEGPYAGSRYSMIKIMHICNAGASLAGGLVMGWMLVRGGEIE